jgi:hypothetical protein
MALVVDDAHWADAASLRFLALLLPRLEELPAAVLLAARPAEGPGPGGEWGSMVGPALAADLAIAADQPPLRVQGGRQVVCTVSTGAPRMND